MKEFFSNVWEHKEELLYMGGFLIVILVLGYLIFRAEANKTISSREYYKCIELIHETRNNLNNKIIK